MSLVSCLLAAAITCGGKPAADVVLDVNPTHPQLAYAAKELTNWVCKISGASLPIVTNAAQSTAKTKIILGTPDRSAAVKAFAAKRSADFEKLGDSDGFIIAEEGGFLGFGDKTIYLAAKKTKGVLNAVYRFLERNSDIIWVRPMQGDNGFGTVYGHHPDLENTVKDLVDVPSFPYYRYWSGGDNAFQARLLNCEKCIYWSPWMKGTPKEISVYGDDTEMRATLGLGIIDKYKKTNPEVLPLLENGKRDMGLDHQLCFMNPKSLELFTIEAEKIVAQAPKTVVDWRIGLADGWGVCNCEYCLKPIVLPDGTRVEPTAPNFRGTQYALFTNRLSDNLRKKFPYLNPMYMDAYLFTAIPPAVKVPGRIGPYCPYVKNHKRPVYDDVVNKQWHERNEGYRAMGMPFFTLYEYYLCWTTPEFFHATSEIAQLDYKYYLPEMKGLYLDVNGSDWYPSKHDGQMRHEDASAVRVRDMSAIEFWVQSRLMWDVDLDIKAARREFCRRAYREAGEIMGDYFEKLAANYNADPAGCYWNDDPVNAAKHYIVEKELAGWVRETLEKALKTAQHPSSKELIRRHQFRMLHYIEVAEKSPKKVTLDVPQLEGKPDQEFDGAYWSKAVTVGPWTRINNAQEAVSNCIVKVAHDRKNLYLAFRQMSESFLKKFKRYADAGLVGKPMASGTVFEWDTPNEIYFDGDLGAKGSYYMFSNMFNERKWTSVGASEMKEPIEWQVKTKPIAGGVESYYVFPLQALGVDISKGNKVNAMFIGNNYPGSAWNAGQWHAPTSFQVLRLEMK